MDNQQQPECPADFGWMKPGFKVLGKFFWGGGAEMREAYIKEPPQIDGDDSFVVRVEAKVGQRTLFQYVNCSDVMPASVNAWYEMSARLAEAEARVRELFDRNNWLEDRANAAESMLDDLRFESEDAVKHFQTSIAAAVAVLRGIEFLSKEFAGAEARNPDACIVVKTDLLNRAGSGVLKALAILEGRDQG